MKPGRKSKLINNPLKQKQHYCWNMNFDSIRVGETFHFTQRDRSLWTCGKPTIQQDQILRPLKKAILTGNCDRFYLQTEQNDNEIQNEYQLSKEDSLPQSKVLNKINSIKALRSITQNHEQPVMKNYQSPVKFESTKPGHELMKDNQQIKNISATKTVYKTFFYSPRDLSNKNNNLMPDFYQSVTPKNLNIPYKTLAQTFEQRNYFYAEHPISRPREYSPDSLFKKQHILTNKSWKQLDQERKKYY